MEVLFLFIRTDYTDGDFLPWFPVTQIASRTPYKADSTSYSGLKASIFDVFSPLSDTFQVCIKQSSSKADKIDNRVSAFQQETGTDKNILVTLITVKPVKENAWTDTVSSFVTLQDLLV